MRKHGSFFVLMRYIITYTVSNITNRRYSMELIKNTVRLCETAAEGTMRAMADGDVIVPDVKPDILKILQVDADACITDRYFENGRLVVCGRVDYKVLYIPEQKEEKIKSILTSMEFRQSADSGGADSDSAMITKAMVERVEFNAVNSRKLRLRAIVNIAYEICNITEKELCTDINGEDAEKKMTSVGYENIIDISQHEFTLKEILEIPSGQRSVNEILKTDVRISDIEYKTVTGKIIVKGNAGICILYTDTDMNIKYLEAEVPFTEVFDTGDAGENTVFDIDYSVMGSMSELQPDNDGDMRVVEVDVDIEMQLKGIETMREDILCDCFVPHTKTVCKTEKLTLTETVQRPRTQNTMREIIEFPNNMPEVAGVYNVMTNEIVESVRKERNRIICEGKIEVYVLCLTSGEENPVCSIKKDIPFSYMLDCKDTDEVETKVKATVNHISYNLNSGGALELRCLIEIEGKLIKTVVWDNITEVDCQKQDKRRGIVIYFTKEGDSLWDVAKRYSVLQERIERYNSIENSTITAGMRLLIPV